MYVRKLSIYDFRCFGKAILDLQYPGRRGGSDLNNVNLVLGDNGGGKSSVLRAIAVAILAPVLIESGWVPYRVVRRPGAEKSLLKVGAVLDKAEWVGPLPEKNKTRHIDMLARFDFKDGQTRDRLHLESTPRTPISEQMFDDDASAFFVVGYGATRRVETGDYNESTQRRTRGLRYLRVAGLFEDHVPLRPIQSWFMKLPDERKREASVILNRLLPSEVRFTAEFDDKEQHSFLISRAGPRPSLRCLMATRRSSAWRETSSDISATSQVTDD